MKSTPRILFLALASLACLALLFAWQAAEPTVEPAAASAQPAATAADAGPAMEGAGIGGRVRAPRAAYQLETGDRVELDVSLAVGGSIAMADAAPQEFGCRIEGPLSLTVLARRAGEFALLGTMAGARVAGRAHASAPAADALRAVLDEGFVVRMGTDGSVRGYRFPAMASAEQRNQVRTLVAALRADVGAPGATAWSALEADATGTAHVHGTSADDGRTIERTKVAYEARGTDVLPAVEGSGRAVLDVHSGWWSEVAWSEAAVLEVAEARLVVRAAATLQATLTACEFATAAPVQAFDWDAPWSPACGALDRDGAAVDPEHLALERELRGVSMQAVLQQLRILLQQDADDEQLHAARRRIVWLVRNDANALRDLQALVNEPGVDAALVAEALGAAGAADTLAAQEFLAGLAREPLAATTRLSALHALFQATEPGAAVAAAEAVFGDAGATAELQGTSLLLLGALADERATDAAHVQSLLSREQAALERGLAVDWLEALGNAGRPEVVDAALRHLGAPDERHRAAAVSAARRTMDARAVAALVERARTDDSALVRMRAIEVLAQRAGHAALASLERAAREDRDANVRLTAVLGLASRPERDAVRTVLQYVAGQDATREVREAAAAALARLEG